MGWRTTIRGLAPPSLSYNLQSSGMYDATLSSGVFTIIVHESGIMKLYIVPTVDNFFLCNNTIGNTIGAHYGTFINFSGKG